MTYVRVWHRSKKQDDAAQRWEKAISSADWPPPCPHCGETLLTSEDRGLHCDGCDNLTSKDIDGLLNRFS